jgi:hypothetical protein
MGVSIEDLWDHEGYAVRRLPDSTLTGVWTHDTREFTAYLAACGCGWRGTRELPPTEAGEELAVAQWRWEHAQPERCRQAARRREELARVLGWLGDQADRLQDPAVLERVRRALDRTRDLVEARQRDLEQNASEREAGDGH